MIDDSEENLEHAEKHRNAINLSMSALILAVKFRRYKMIKRLLSLNANPKIVTIFGDSAVSVARHDKNFDPEVLRQLVIADFVWDYKKHFQVEYDLEMKAMVPEPQYHVYPWIIKHIDVDVHST